MNNAEKKPMMGHLEDLRKVLVQCLSVFLFGCIGVGCFFPLFARFLNYPLNKAFSKETNLLQGLVTTSPMDIFSVLMQVCGLGGLGIALPFILIFVAKFITPGLNKKEKSLLIPGSIAILFLFVVGASFSYFFILPATLGAAISLNKLFGFELIWSAPTYYGLVVWMTLGVGLCFEFPLILVACLFLGILSTKKLRAWRRYVIVLVLVISAAITPTGDPFSLAILALPLYCLYEISILLGKYVTPKVGKTALKEKATYPWRLEE